MKEIEEFLRENKPHVKEDPTFILEAQRRMEQVDGIKAEVDRQRKYGRKALVAALIAGLAIGSAATALAYLYPIDANTVGEGLLDSIRAFLDTWKNYLIFVVAALGVTLGLVLTRTSRGFT